MKSDRTEVAHDAMHAYLTRIRLAGTTVGITPSDNRMRHVALHQSWVELQRPQHVAPTAGT
jgi:hypothetical protein